MNKNYVLKLIIIFFFITSNVWVFALTTNTWAISKVYSNFIIKLESKLSLKNQLVVLESLSSKLNTKLKSKTITTKSIILLKELNTLNNNKISEIKGKLNITSYVDNVQIEIEKSEIKKLSDLKNNFVLPDYITKLISGNRKFVYVNYSEKNPFFEFVENNKVKRLIFTNYFEITDKNYDLFKNKAWYIINLTWKYVFIENYEIEDKIPYSNSSSYFKSVILDLNNNFYEINWAYYTYKFNSYNYIDDKYWFYPKSLDQLWINIKNSILYKNIDKYVFITSYSDQVLIKSDLLTWITDKKLFLSMVSDDKKSLNYDTYSYFKELKLLSEKLTSWLTREDKIKKIYDYVLKNITYTNPIDLTRPEIFSWIDTYKNKDWVCEWYVKLMAYMLMFAWIEDVEVIRWFVLNASDFPNVWHAWIKIWNYYYDPTFDDPIWNTQAKEFNQYDYYKLPADLMYTNRYDVADLPEELKSKSKEFLNELVNKNLYNLVSKYKKSNYNLMNYVLFLYNNWFSYNHKIKISDLENLIVTYSIDWKDMSYIKDWRKYFIKKLKFYQLTNENLKDVLSVINYDISSHNLLKWDLWNWSYEYRLAYEFEIF